MNAGANDAIEEPHLVLLLLPSQRKLFPMSTAALTVSQGTREKLENEHRDALILEPDGTVKRFSRIEMLGTYGDTLSRKVLCWLAREKRISVTLTPVAIELSELKGIVIDCVRRGYWEDEETTPDELARIVRAVESAPDAQALFRSFDLGTLEDALDQL